MKTLLVTHPAGLAHDTGPGHPERPDRLRAVLAALDAERFAALDRRQAPAATPEQVALAHPAAYVERVIAAIPSVGLAALDADTIVSPGSGEAALRAAGGVIAAVDAVMAGEAAHAFCATRPPGHHAERQRAMGFCLFNSIAIGARHAQEKHGAGRVAVVDFDVHHGNGTQDVFWDWPDLFYASTHQFPLYPGTGRASETGGSGNVLNLPLAPMSGGAEFRAAISGHVLPALDAFRPDLLMISAGFDAHVRDPLASLRLTEEDFAWVTTELAAAADRLCAGRVVSTLEGGYDLQALATSAAAHVATLMAG